MSISMGHEVLVTPIQMLQAFCALANGGTLVPPSVVKAIIRSDGTLGGYAGGLDRKRKLLKAEGADPLLI